jgi:hypothetical protein
LIRLDTEDLNDHQSRLLDLLGDECEETSLPDAAAVPATITELVSIYRMWIRATVVRLTDGPRGSQTAAALMRTPVGGTATKPIREVSDRLPWARARASYGRSVISKESVGGALNARVAGHGRIRPIRPLLRVVRRPRIGSADLLS